MEFLTEAERISLRVTDTRALGVIDALTQALAIETLHKQEAERSERERFKLWLEADARIKELEWQLDVTTKGRNEDFKTEEDRADAAEVRVRELETLAFHRETRITGLKSRLTAATTALRGVYDYGMPLPREVLLPVRDFLAGQPAVQLPGWDIERKTVASAPQAIPNKTLSAHEIAKDIALSKLPDFRSALAQTRASQPATPECKCVGCRNGFAAYCEVVDGGQTDAETEDSGDDLKGAIACCRAWEPDVRLIGNVRASTLLRLLERTEAERTVLDAMRKAIITEHSCVVFDCVQDEYELASAELARRGFK